MRDKDVRRTHGAFYVEGEVTLRVLLAQRSFEVRSVLISEKRLDSLDEALKGLDPELPVFVVPQGLMERVVGFPIHRGVLALAARPEPVSAHELLSTAGADSLAVALEGLTNTDNVGATFRNAAAFGVDAILLDPTCADPLYRKAVRVSAGAALQVPFARCDDPIASLKDAGYRVLALTPEADAIPLSELSLSGRRSVVLGTEGSGLKASSLARADLRVRIEMVPGFDSLNVATAGAIALYGLSASRANRAA